MTGEAAPRITERVWRGFASLVAVLVLPRLRRGETS
jgi:hypothetical protein